MLRPISSAIALVTALAVTFPPLDAQGQKRKKKKRKSASVQALTAGGPVLKYEQFRRGVEVKVAAKREEEISKIKRLLSFGPPDEEIPDIKFRLAELYFAKSQFYFFRSQEADDAISRAKSPGAKAEKEREKRGHTKEMQVWLKRAVGIYKEIRLNYPKYARMPEVLFALGQMWWTAGRFDDAIEAYRELIQHFKDSPLVHDAWLAFGEYYFNNGALNKALKSYEFAAADKRSRVYGFALYKQAWCYYNLSDWGKALQKFRATVFYSQMADELSGQNKISLAREAQKDFVKTYAHQGDPQKARFVLADIVGEDECNGEECRKLLEKLGNDWKGKGRFEDAAQIFSQLIRLDANNTRNPYFQATIVDMRSRSGDKPRVIDECKRLLDAYNRVVEVVKNKDSGAEESERDRINLEDARTLAESTIRRLAQLWNREAKKTRQAKTYEYAEALYRMYLELFTESKWAYQMRFQYADLLYKVERFDEAAHNYRRTLEADPKGKYAVDAANDYILAIGEHLKDLRLPRPKPGKHQIDIHEQRRRLLNACDMYAKVVPADKATKLVKIKYKAAKIYYDHNHFEEAIRRFDDIIENHPADDQAEFAANLIIDIHNLREDWDNLYAASAKYRAMSELVRAHESLKKDLIRFGQFAKFKLINIQQKDLEARKASLRPIAVEYEKFQTEFPKSENADKALFNASVVWDSLGETERADKLRRKLLRRYKDSPLRADVAHYTARSFEEKAEYRKAANLFSNFAEKYPKDPRARDAMYNAAVFYAGVGAVKRATTLRESYLKQWGKTKGGEKEAASIYFAIAADLEGAGRLRSAAQRYGEFARRFSSDDRAFEALWRQAKLLEKMRKTGPARKVKDTLFATYAKRKKKLIKMPKTAADYASRIAFERNEELFRKYKKLRIVKVNLRKPKRFQRSIEEKARARQKVISSYTKVVTQYQQAYSTVSSLYRIAVSWDVFVEALLKIPCPRQLTVDQCELFKEQLEQKIGPARDSAYQAYLTCIRKSNELKTFTPYSTRCVKALENLAPEQYPPLEERRVAYKPPKNRLDLKSNSLLLRSPSSGQSKEADR